MTRRPHLLGIILSAALPIFIGCHPQQPFYFGEDGDLSHYKGVATEIEYPDTQNPISPEADQASHPFSLENRTDDLKPEDITLEEAIRIALSNNKVMRNIGGNVQAPPDFFSRNPEAAPTIWDPAIAESDPQRGVEAALAAFDAQWHSVAQWQNFHEPRNTELSALYPVIRKEDDGTFQNQLRKTTATGGTFAISHDILYTNNNTPSPARNYPTDWTTEIRAEFRQPLLRGAGVQVNRIAGPNATPGVNNGVMIARINTDVALTDFEAAVRNLVGDVETAYWELYYAYRNLDTQKAGRDAGLRTYQEARTNFEKGRASRLEEAQAKQAYYEFRTGMEQALTELYTTESKLRYLMGLASTDGRLFRPKDEPTTAKMTFDWNDVLCEALARNVELRQQRWIVKRRELELISAKNFLLPKLDLTGSYQWMGLGNRLLDSSGGTGDFTQAGSNSYQNLTSGGFGDWSVGLSLDVPIGYRREMAGVRNAELMLVRTRARLQELELEVSHQLAHSLRLMESDLVMAESNFNRLVASKTEVEVAEARVEWGYSGTPLGSSSAAPSSAKQPRTLADVLDARRREAVAEANYYRMLVNYQEAITQVHLRKGSLLEYNGVYLAEGPWPAKAYFDAERRARARDASIYLDYGFTQPRVISRGPVDQQADSAPMPDDAVFETPVPTEAKPRVKAEPEPELAPPKPEPLKIAPESVKMIPEPNTNLSEPPTWKLDGNQSTKANKSAEPARTAAKSAVGPAGYLEPIGAAAEAGKSGRATPAQSGGLKSNSTKPSETTTSRIKWVDAAQSDSRYESVANTTPAKSDRDAPSWKGLER
jgi:hypothetical protein